MALTPEQREARRTMLGGSEISAVMGMDPYQSASDVYLIKTGQVADFEGNDSTDRGIRLEPVLLDFAQQELGVELERDVMIVHPSGMLCANLDARALGIVVEAKSSVNSDEWGTPGSDEIPERVIVQVHHQMALAGPDVRIGWVPVLLPGFKSLDFRIYRVDRDDRLADAIEKAGIDFMEKHVLAGIEPTDYRPSLEVLKRVRREPNKIVNLSDELVDALVIAKATAKQADDDVEAAQAAVLAALGDAEAGRYSRGVATYMEQTARRLDSDRIKKQYPAIAAECVAESRFRVLRMKADKATKSSKQLVNA